MKARQKRGIKLFRVHGVPVKVRVRQVVQEPVGGQWVLTNLHVYRRDIIKVIKMGSSIKETFL